MGNPWQGSRDWDARSENLYWWIDKRATGLGRWLDSIIGRFLFATIAAAVTVYGYRQPEGTFLRSISPELFGIVLTAVIIDYVNERRQDIQRRKILTAQLGSKYRDVTEMAITELRQRGWLEDGSLANALLTEANLEDADLTQANLRHADLKKANLSGAVLQGAILAEAYMIHANLDGADLTEANLCGAWLYSAEFGRAILVATDLSDAHLNGRDLSGTDMVRVKAVHAKLESAILTEVNMYGAVLDGAFLRKASLRGAVLRLGSLKRCNLDEACLANADLFSAKLRGASLKVAELSGAEMTGADLTGACLHSANFTNASMNWADLTRVQSWTIEQLEQSGKLERATMPDGVRLQLSGFENSDLGAGPTFQEWKAQYLAEHGGSSSDVRDPFCYNFD